MKKEELKQSPVLFREEDHTYWLGDKQLSGITGMIRRQLFPDKYNGVPEAVMNARAAYGSEFHKDMELYINMGIEADTEAFRVFKEHYGDIRFIESEYVVSDCKNYASPIDAIDDNGILYDFKTTTSKDVEYWRWQLSVYWYLFTLQNGFEPSGLRVLWINKDMRHDMVDIEPYPMELVEELLDCDERGLQFELPKSEAPVPAGLCEALAEVEREIIKRETELKEIKASHDEMKASILASFLKSGVRSWETDDLVIKVKDAYTRTTVDSKALKEKHPEVYAECSKESVVKESLTIKIK